MTDWQKQIYEDLEIGFHNALYNFWNNDIGYPPTDWDITTTGDGKATIIPEYDGHRKVLELYRSTEDARAFVANTFPSKTSGSIEFWLQGYALEISIGLRRGTESNNCIYIAYLAPNETGFWTWLGAGGGWVELTKTFDPDHWYHFKIDWNASGWQVAIDDKLYGAEYAFPFIIELGTGLTSLELQNFGAFGEFFVYFDAIDYSWATGYTPGRNKTFTKNWNQETYPAIIQYYDPKNTNKINRITEHILIELDQGNIQVTQLGQNIAYPREAIDIIHVFLEVRRNPQNTFYEDKQFLKEVIDAFEAWLKSMNYPDLWVVGMYPDREKLRVDIWMNGYDVS